MTTEQLRERYRTVKLMTALECSEAKAGEVHRKVCLRLSDEEFEQYAAEAAKGLAHAKARAGLQGTTTPPPAQAEEEAERTRADIADYIDAAFSVPD